MGTDKNGRRYSRFYCLKPFASSQSLLLNKIFDAVSLILKILALCMVYRIWILFHIYLNDTTVRLSFEIVLIIE